MTRRILDREKLKRATEASKRVLEHARPRHFRTGDMASTWLKRPKAGRPRKP